MTTITTSMITMYSINMSLFPCSIEESDEADLTLKLSLLWFDLLNEDGSGSPSLMAFVSCVLSDNYVDTDTSAEGAGAGYKEHIKYTSEKVVISIKT